MLSALGVDAQGVLDLVGSIADPASGITQIRVDTTWLPPFTSDRPLEGSPSPVLAFLKPKITVTFDSGRTFVSAPYGDPGPESNWPILAAALMIGGAFGALAIIRRFSR